MNSMMIVLFLAIAAPAPAEEEKVPTPNEVLDAEPKPGSVDAERRVRVLRARCALAEAIGKKKEPTCDAERIDGTPARASTLSVERVDGLRKGGPLDGPVPEPVAELLGLVTEIAVERAKQNGLAFLQRRIRRAVCSVELPWVPGMPKTPSMANADGAPTKEKAKRELAKHPYAGQPTTSKLAFPATCTLLTDVPLDQLAEAPRRMIPALVADLIGTIGTTTWKFLREHSGSRYAVVAPAVDIALRLAVVSWLGKANSPSSTEVLAVLNTLLALRCSTDDGSRCKAGTWTAAPAVAIALEVLAELVARGGKGDVATLVSELSPTDDPEIIARAVELAAIGVRALGLDEPLDARDPKAQWTATMAFVFESAIDLADHAGDSAQKLALEHLRDLTMAAADENIPAAVSAGASLLRDLLPRCRASRA